MAKEDEEKTSFITSQGIFWYFKMPFGLRNVRTTYQRLVDKAFHKQIGRNLEVYVDDLVIKICMEDEIIRDIEETFKTLREINMKLNSQKCTFEVEGGMFLGYKVNTKGIKNRKLASLNKFLAKSADKSLPFFKTLKKRRRAPMEVEEELPKPWILFMDGSSCADGSGAGLILTNPEGTKFTYALRFKFEVTNNEAKYEALIAGLMIAEQMGVKNLQANVDSRLVVNQVNKTYIAKEADMIQYLEKVRTLTNSFRMFSIKQVPRSENKKADTLSKITSTLFAHLSKQVLVEELKEKSINKVGVLAVVEEEWDTWMTLIYEPLQANYVLKEIHGGSCSMHAGTRFIMAKALQTGYYWPTMHKDAEPLIREHCIMIKSSNRGTPFLLIYGTKAVIPVEIGMPTLRIVEVDMMQNDKALEINMDLLEERKERAATCEAKGKAKMEKYYNSKVRSTSFKPGDLMYRRNDASHTEEVGKLGPKWEGPYEVTKALGKGTYKLRDRELWRKATFTNMECPQS
nr:reverse transcriptase domain-containing protein [Tanacetum cinerariifolium]